MVSRMPSDHPSEDLTLHRFGRSGQSAPTLLLMHGLADSGRCWPDAVRRWKKAYRVLAWDARGHGESERFTKGELAAGVGETMYADAVDLLETLAAEGISRPILVGHSMGGGTAAAVGWHRPDLVRALVLEDPALGARDDYAKGSGPKEQAKERVAGDQDIRRKPKRALKRQKREAPSWPSSEYAPWLDAKLETDTRMLADPVITVATPRLKVASKISVPTLVVTGARAEVVRGEYFAALRDLENPCLSFEVVKKAGHCVRRDRADGFHAVVDPWLEAQFRL